MVLLWTLLLLLLPPHSSAEESQNYYAQLGGSVTIYRQDWYEHESKYVRWYFYPNQGNSSLIWKHPQKTDPQKEGPPEWTKRVSLSKDHHLIISPVRGSDFDGLFKCEQQISTNKNGATYKLKPVKMPTERSLLVGEDLSLKCELDSKVKFTLNWFKPSGQLYQVLDSTDTLRVRNISAQDSGPWRCEAKHYPKVLKAQTDVTVVDLAPSPSDPIYTSVSSRSYPSLPCSLYSTIPWSTVENKSLHGGSWTFKPLNQSDSPKPLLPLLTLDFQKPPFWRIPNITNSKAGSLPSLKSKEVKAPDLSVQTAELTPDYRGTYTCSLEFSLGRKLSSEVQLEVLEVYASSRSAYEGDTVNLTCSLGHPMPSDVQVKWICPKSSMFCADRPSNQTNLSINKVRVQDSGKWRCELIKNGTTLTSADVTLKIEKVPVASWIFVAAGSALIFILLIIITVFLVRRHRQQVLMYRRRKIRFCCCKTPQAKGFYKT